MEVEAIHIVNFRSISDLCRQYTEERDRMAPKLKTWLERYMLWVKQYLYLRTVWKMDIKTSRPGGDAPGSDPSA